MIKNSIRPKKYKIILTLIILTVLILVIALSAPPYARFSEFYYFTLNPLAGTGQLERQYKEVYSRVERSFASANTKIDTMRNNKMSAEEAANNHAGLLRDFSAINTYFKEMLATDLYAQSLDLPPEYVQFYKLRYAADKKDYAAFGYLATGQREMMKALVAYTGFHDTYLSAADKISDMDETNDLSQKNLNELHILIFGFNMTYRKVSGLTASEHIFSQRILENIRNQKDLDTAFKEFGGALDRKDSERQIESFRLLAFRLNENKTDLYAAVPDWLTENIDLMERKWEEMHHESLTLYEKTYTYARQKKLEPILNIWNETTPGQKQV